MNITPDQKSCRLRSCMIGWLLFYSMYLKDCLLRLVLGGGHKKALGGAVWFSEIGACVFLKAEW
ncbi:hypothetical protein [Bordetella bronchiseptica]|uniref:hypothetical protein n=1 Tax=Bordetella bronchiseptica TaxID=518 RepID=UPI0015F31CDA|nr:hypothetical protein [Bordetella bronchiseptica]